MIKANFHKLGLKFIFGKRLNELKLMELKPFRNQIKDLLVVVARK